MRRVARMTAVIALALAIAAPAGAAPPRDRIAPVVRFTTPSDAILVSAPVDHELTRVRGTVTDRNGRGVRAVAVVFCANANRLPGGGYTCGSSGPSVVSPLVRRSASVACSDARRRICIWSADVPATPGRYLVIAVATDRAGNQRGAGPIFITVV